MSECDHSGGASYCMHHLQDAFDALEAVKGRYPNPITTVGLPENLIDPVSQIIFDVEPTARREGYTLDDCARTLFIDGLMMGLLLAARAPKDHARHALAEVHDGEMVETVTLPGLRCPSCGRLAYDMGGGRACYAHDEEGRPTKPCGVMEPVALTATATQNQQSEEH